MLSPLTRSTGLNNATERQRSLLATSKRNLIGNRVTLCMSRIDLMGSFKIGKRLTLIRHINAGN